MEKIVPGLITSGRSLDVEIFVLGEVCPLVNYLLEKFVHGDNCSRRILFLENIPWHKIV